MDIYQNPNTFPISETAEQKQSNQTNQPFKQSNNEDHWDYR